MKYLADPVQSTQSEYVLISSKTSCRSILTAAFDLACSYGRAIQPCDPGAQFHLGNVAGLNRIFSTAIAVSGPAYVPVPVGPSPLSQTQKR